MSTMITSKNFGKVFQGIEKNIPLDPKDPREFNVLKIILMAMGQVMNKLCNNNLIHCNLLRKLLSGNVSHISYDLSKKNRIFKEGKCHPFVNNEPNLCIRNSVDYFFQKLRESFSKAFKLEKWITKKELVPTYFNINWTNFIYY